MNERGYGVDWQDSHKYITFTDLKRQEQGEKQCKIRNNKLEKYYNMDFGKESLEHEFEGNARSQQTEQRAREQLAADRGAKADNRTAEADNIGAFIANIAAQEMQKLADKNAQLNEADEVQEIQKENADLKKQNEQLKQVCADTGEMISNFKKETERLQKQKKLLIGVVNTLMEKCMGVTNEEIVFWTSKRVNVGAVAADNKCCDRVRCNGTGVQQDIKGTTKSSSREKKEYPSTTPRN